MTETTTQEKARELALAELRHAAMRAHVPTHMHKGFERWILEGKMGGSFMNALLSNDLMQTFALADDINIGRIGLYTKWLYNHTPAGCFGSPENVEMWSELGGLVGWHKQQLEPDKHHRCTACESGICGDGLLCESPDTCVCDGDCK